MSSSADLVNASETAAPRRYHRLAYAAAHLVMREDYRDVDPARLAEMIDWDATMQIRRYLSDLDFGIAEAMDTAQRFEIGWEIARTLIEKTGQLSLPVPMVAGAGCDHVAQVNSKTELIDAVAYQVDFIRQAGGVPILLPMLYLAETQASEADFVEVYQEVIRQSSGPILLHWLGKEFLAAMEGYFPGESFSRILEFDPQKVVGAKISLLDAQFEIKLRRQLLTRQQVIFTGDDWNFTDLIAGEAKPVQAWRSWGTDTNRSEIAVGDFSHALLGIFCAIADPARAALTALEAGDLPLYQQTMQRCEALSRVIFESPTEHYKAGLATLHWLNGRQSNRMLPYRGDLRRPLDHLRQVAQLASDCGAITNPTTAAERLPSLEG